MKLYIGHSLAIIKTDLQLECVHNTSTSVVDKCILYGKT
jgi:hypothetical protein